MKYFSEIHKTKVFKNANEFEMQAMMYCFKIRFKTVDKGDIIVEQGSLFDDIVMILKGGAKVENTDQLGNVSIVLKLEAGGIFGLESTYAGDTTYKDSLIATEKSLIMFLNKNRTINPCVNRCKRHEFVVKNLMQVVAERNIELLDKLKHMSKKSIREKLLSYLHSQQLLQNSQYFEIPFNKTELANYLSVDRSAMSTELGKMKNEGLIDFDKKEYRIIKDK